MTTILRDDEFEKIADAVKPDIKKRVVLPKSVIAEGVSYRVFVNSHGQIILDPQVTIPASELWVFKNKHILASIDKGMAESSTGKVKKRGSFARYVKDES